MPRFAVAVTAEVAEAVTRQAVIDATQNYVTVLEAWEQPASAARTYRRDRPCPRRARGPLTVSSLPFRLFSPNRP